MSEALLQKLVALIIGKESTNQLQLQALSLFGERTIQLSVSLVSRGARTGTATVIRFLFLNIIQIADLNLKI